MAKVKPITDDSVFPFGKYAGRKISEIPAHYLLRLYRHKHFFQGLFRYIERNRTDLNISEFEEVKP